MCPKQPRMHKWVNWLCTNGYPITCVQEGGVSNLDSGWGLVCPFKFCPQFRNLKKKLFGKGEVYKGEGPLKKNKLQVGLTTKVSLKVSQNFTFSIKVSFFFQLFKFLQNYYLLTYWYIHRYKFTFYIIEYTFNQFFQTYEYKN